MVGMLCIEMYQLYARVCRWLNAIEKVFRCLTRDAILSNGATDAIGFHFAFAFARWVDDCDSWGSLVPQVV
ncbi:hypothetical protein B296_00036677 [Ensete ventricosum]|uniref:Uncharacterized protein n=1 Tax=Ensete ventricosum TaxID=4639 RepID=A0A426XRS1_ENSVE|nr:hypothetical protein B296_00036677 [Ensete ventricosum]